MAVAGIETEVAAQTSTDGELVVHVRGRRTRTTRVFGRRLRRRLADEVGPLRSSRDMRATLNKLDLPPEERVRPENYAVAGAAVGARHILDVEAVLLKDKPRLKVRLIRVGDGKLLLDQTTTYGPSTVAADAERILMWTLAELQASNASRPTAPTITGSPEGPPIVGVIPNEDEAQGKFWYTPDEGIEPAASQTDAIPDLGIASRPLPRIWHFTLAAGSGVYRNYAVGSETVDRSQLSARTSPVPMVRGAFRLIAPKVGLGIHADVSFRTFDTDIDVEGLDPESVRTQLLDVDGGVLLRLSFGTIDLIPKVGVRVRVAAVEGQNPSVLPSSIAVAPIAGLDAIFGAPGWDFRAGFDVGWYLVYDEDDSETGDDGQGLTVAGRLGLTAWLTDQLGIGIDSRLIFDRIAFDGTPTRFVPEAEQGQLTDPDLDLLDVQVLAAVRLRI